MYRAILGVLVEYQTEQDLSEFHTFVSPISANAN